MTERERADAGQLFNPAEFEAEQMRYQDLLWEFNALKPSQLEEQAKMMKDIFAECGEGNFIQRPMYANWGGKHVHLGSHIYANYNLTLVDDGQIYIGDWSKFGPNVPIATPGHPILPELRTGDVLQYNKDVHIGKCVWVGAGTVICPGVTIGDNTVIGAGSVVTRDIPANSVAYGNPCRVVRQIEAGEGGRDREYFFRGDSIEWEELREKCLK